ncbi:MAG: TonB C-terminal domain-containing protein [Rhizobacter sp.]|nr:TonB C-terminal domain-containing protein [Rhizobacter sp.]
MSRIAAISATLFASSLLVAAVAQPASGALPGIAAKPPPSYDATYAARLIAAIRPNIVVTESVPQDATAEVEITTEPSGRVASHRLVKSSGAQAWDRAVMRAVENTERLPLAPDGTIPRRIHALFRPGAP